MHRSFFGAVVCTLLISALSTNAFGQPWTEIQWDGGDWNSDNGFGSWNYGTAEETFGRRNGLEVGSGEKSNFVNISDATLHYDPNVNGDLRFAPASLAEGETERAPGPVVNLTFGASLVMNSNSNPEGKWTQFDGDELNMSRSSSLVRTRSGSSISGGALIFGSWRSYENQIIDINLEEGSKIDNHGQVWFGAWAGNAPGIQVNMTINDGSLDLTGGDSYDLFGDGGTNGGPGNADLVFINGLKDGSPKDENYVINFIGPGSISVDKAGILNPIANGDESDPASYGDSLTTLLSYEDLWNVGILQANGQSGLDGANFAEFFSTTGSAGADDYELMSLLEACHRRCDRPSVALLGDCNGDGAVDADDLACIVGSESGTVVDVLAATGLLAGDLDADGSVAFDDFLLLSTNFGSDGVGYTRGDIDGNGNVGFSDFLVLSSNFGQSAAATAAVPEPSGLGLIAIALIGGLASRPPRVGERD